MADSALHEEILLLEAKIEEMNETIAMCRKAILVSKVALAARSGQLGLIRWRAVRWTWPVSTGCRSYANPERQLSYV